MRVAIATSMLIFIACSEGESSKTNKSEDRGAPKDCVKAAPIAQKSFNMRNGKTSSEDEFEFVGMVYAQNMRIAIFPPLKITQKSCSGTLVCSNVVLTAGHCIDPGELPSKFSFHTAVKPGEKPVINFTTTPRGAEYKVLSKTDEIGRQDMALLRLDRNLKIKPAKLWFKTLPEPAEKANGPEVTIVGYGSTATENGIDAGGGTRKFADMVFRGHMNNSESDSTHQMGILYPRLGLVAPMAKTSNACSGDSGGAAMVGDRLYGVLAKIMYYKDGKMQPTPNCEESNITLVSVLARQKNWLQENLERMCSDKISFDEGDPPANPALDLDVGESADATSTMPGDVSPETLSNNPCD